MIVISELTGMHNDMDGISIGAGANVVISDSKLNGNGRNGVTIHTGANVSMNRCEVSDNKHCGVEITELLYEIPREVLRDAKASIPEEPTAAGEFLRNKLAPYLGTLTNEGLKELVRRLMRGDL